VAARSLAEDIADVLADFPSFCSLLEIKLKSGGMVRFNYERWNAEQKRFERERSGRDIVIKPRQIGFSTLELARDLQFAVVNPGVNVQVVVHDAGMKDQLFLNLRVMGECLKRRGLLPKTRYSTKTEIVFADTGSAVRIVESGSTEKAASSKGRSGTIHRLHATEMAFWGAAAETWNALSAATPDTAEIVIESTANGAGGLFYEMVQAARRDEGRYKPHFFPWYDHANYRAIVYPDFDPLPRDKWEEKLRALGCTDTQIAWWRSKFGSVDIGPDKTLQEFPVDADSCFRVAGRQYFAPDVIDAMMERVEDPKRKVQLRAQGRALGELHVFTDPRAGEEYIVGADVSEGTGGDSSAATVIAKSNAQVVATFCADNIEPGDFGLALAEVGKLYAMARLAPERNNHGHATLRAILHEAKYPSGRVYKGKDGKHGWDTNAVTRPVMIDDLGAAVRAGIAWSPDRWAVTECKTLVHNDKGKVEARGKGRGKDGSKDDRWMSWCIAFQVRNQPVQEFQRTHIPGY
jgi:hypothetical protein